MAVHAENDETPGKTLHEEDWDRIIADNSETLAEALKMAGLIRQDSTLVVLGAQIDNVDLLLAEVTKSESDNLKRGDSTTWPMPLRLVLLEDKLFRNPEGKRKVLAQILDYAETSKAEWNADWLAAQDSLKNHAAWIKGNSRQIDVMLATNDVLLVIAGDDIHDGLLRLARRFAASDDPTNLSELCLVSMAMYCRGTERLLIPHVVSAVQRHQRQVTVRVKAIGQIPDGCPISATWDRDEDDEAKLRASPETNDDAQEFLEKAKQELATEAGPPRFEVTKDVRKLLSYSPVGTKYRLGYQIHFGAGSKDAWSPIRVGLFVESEERDVWTERVKTAMAKQQLPPDTKLTEIGVQRLTAMVCHEWSDPAQLTDELRGRILKELRMFMQAFKDYEQQSQSAVSD